MCSAPRRGGFSGNSTLFCLYAGVSVLRVGKGPVVFNIFDDRFMTVWKRRIFFRRIRWRFQEEIAELSRAVAALVAKEGAAGGFGLCRLLRFQFPLAAPRALGKKLRAWVYEFSSLGSQQSNSFS